MYSIPLISYFSRNKGNEYYFELISGDFELSEFELSGFNCNLDLSSEQDLDSAYTLVNKVVFQQAAVNEQL